MAVPQRFQSRTPELLKAFAWSACAVSASLQPSHAQNNWHICAPFEQRFTCVVDGDTLWYAGEKMRLLTIDAPELGANCAKERAAATAATQLLVDLLSAGAVVITRHGTDPYDRTLVTIDGAKGPIGETLVNRGLAVHFGPGSHRDWCR